MNGFMIIKNGLVLSLDRKGMTGFFTVIIRNGKIFLIDYENKFTEKEFLLKYPGSEIIDATGKLVMPGFFNSRLVTFYSFGKYFFKKCNYDNLYSWHSLKLIDRFISEESSYDLISDMMKISFARSVENGEIFFCESNFPLKKEFFDSKFQDPDWIKQYFSITINDFTLLTGLTGQEKFVSLGFRTDEDINNYSLTSIKKAISEYRYRVFIEASLSQKTFDSIKKVFGKPLINVLSEMELISPSVIISNPTHLSNSETEILKKKRAAVLISVSDYLNFQQTRTDFDSLISSGMNIILGTGYTGSSIFSELKLLAGILSRSNLSYEHLMKTAIQNPAQVFGIGNLTGSIERNKSADLIILNLKDIRNSLNIPEINSENLCDFIISNLSEKDITHVFIKGEPVVRDGRNILFDTDKALKRSAEISGKIYSAGKYFEYKEKYMMRGRVDMLNTDTQEITEVPKQEIFVDMTETGGEYTGEGEFTILGAKEEEFEKTREKFPAEDISENINEITSLDKGLSFLEEDTISQHIEEEPERDAIKISVTEKTDNQEYTEKEVTTGISKAEKIRFTDESVTGKDSDSVKNEDSESEIPPESKLKKTKLKFGFGDSDKSK